MKVDKLFYGVFKVDGKLATASIYPGNRVYGEELVTTDNAQYRLWNPYRSKLAAAIMNGLKEFHIEKESSVLYLGAATGTTSSHVSDVVGNDGMVYCVEISERSMRDLLKACEVRVNMLPILQDARNVESYGADVGEVDIIYQDIAAKDQSEILIKNSKLLKNGGYAYVAIKSQSIDITRSPNEVFKEFLKDVSGTFKVLEEIDIEPYDKMHLFVTLKKL
ncbi:MAG: fibrillarin-like rRNA/tRNA 2'-O-methyltransferase [Candidatus Micrarchaeota archaeon]|nr:fibrillarin-like rRNA/tRNA 2'-O-methyltransferase [Candidatus Micrarchaeota archaeon]MDE1859237.1 fibrillarin-like rRNA/tRNA 2'-O-methyltransferase [Candidatus Micrarchaeota archaeon]